MYLVDDSKQLLFGGGWADQPHWLVEALEIFKAETAKRLKKEI